MTQDLRLKLDPVLPQQNQHSTRREEEEEEDLYTSTLVFSVGGKRVSATFGA
jgi:hypothetical protein